MSLHLVTGHMGYEHITATDEGSYNIATIGSGSFVLSKGNCFNAAAISNNKIRIQDGDMLFQGRHVRLPENSHEDLTFDAITGSNARNDLIVVRYNKTEIEGIESCELKVIKGVEVSGSPTDPEYISGNITDEVGDLVADFPLYRIKFRGVGLPEIERLFEIKMSYSDLLNKLTGDILSFLTKSVPLNQGGTGADLSSKAGANPYAILRFSSDSEKYPYFVPEPTKAGAFYASSENGAPKFGTLPVENGGTGAASASKARENLGLGELATKNIAAIAQGGTGATTRKTAIANLVKLDMNTVPRNAQGQPAGDTPALWAEFGNCIIYYNNSSVGINKPTSYGMLISLLATTDATSCEQIWLSQAHGTMYVRSGNTIGWNEDPNLGGGDAWKKIFSNKDVIPFENGGTGGKLGDIPAGAIVRRASDGNYLYYTKTSKGVLQASEDNGLPKFDTVPIIMGGTGATSVAKAQENLGIPVFKTLSLSKDNISISAGDAVTVTIDASSTEWPSGYSLLGFKNWTVDNASTSGANASFINVYGLSYNSSSKNLQMKVRNMASSSTAKIKISIAAMLYKD